MARQDKQLLHEIQHELDTMQREIRSKLSKGLIDPVQLCSNTRRRLKELAWKQEPTRLLAGIELFNPRMNEAAYRAHLTDIVIDALYGFDVDPEVINEKERILARVEQECPDELTVTWDCQVAKRCAFKFTKARFLNNVQLVNGVIYRTPYATDQAQQEYEDRLVNNTVALNSSERRVIKAGMYCVLEQLHNHRRKP